MREHGHEAVQLAVQAHVLEHHVAVGFEAAVHVVQLHAGGAAHEPIEHARRQHLGDRVVPLLFVARDQIEAFRQLGQETRDLFGIVLQVGVEREHDAAPARA